MGQWNELSNQQAAGSQAAADRSVYKTEELPACHAQF